MIVSVDGKILKEDPKVKSGCCTFDVTSECIVKGYKHPNGYLLSYLEGVRKERLQFLTCPNQTRTPKWAIGFCTTLKSFTKMEEGPLTDITLIIIRGVREVLGEPHLVYHEWRPEGVSNLHSMIQQYKNKVNAFVALTFNPTPTTIYTSQIHLGVLCQPVPRKQVLQLAHILWVLLQHH